MYADRTFDYKQINLCFICAIIQYSILAAVIIKANIVVQTNTPCVLMIMHMILVFMLEMRNRANGSDTFAYLEYMNMLIVVKLGEFLQTTSIS